MTENQKVVAQNKVIRKFTFTDYGFAHFVRERMMEVL